jgi:uncharacterized protein (TIRG00374 family)
VGIPLSNTAAAFFIERLMDLLAILALVCLTISSSSHHVLILGMTGTIISAIIILSLTPLGRISEQLELIIWLPESLIKTIQSIVRTLLSAKVLLQPGILIIGFIIGVIAWGSEGIGLFMIGKISDHSGLNINLAIEIYSIAILVGVLSFLPGGLGSTEAVMVALLNSNGYLMSDAIMITFICRFMTLWFAVMLGWISILILRFNRVGTI